METIASGDRTRSMTRSSSASSVNSSIKTTHSLESFFQHNLHSVISEMAGNISRNTNETHDSRNAFKQSRNSQITCRIVPDDGTPKFKENKTSIQLREKAKKLFVTLQSEHNVSDFDTKKSLLELNLSLPEAPYKVKTLPVLGLEHSS